MNFAEEMIIPDNEKINVTTIDRKGNIDGGRYIPAGKSETDITILLDREKINGLKNGGRFKFNAVKLVIKWIYAEEIKRFVEARNTSKKIASGITLSIALGFIISKFSGVKK